MLLDVVAVDKSFPVQGAGLFSRRRTPVLREVTFGIAQGEAVALVGESGSGKSTLARLVLGMDAPDRGAITLQGESVRKRSARRRHMSAVFQDHVSSINPGYTAFDAIAEPLLLAGVGRAEIGDRVREAMARMGLPGDLAGQKPHEMSGGQAQRVCLARAIVSCPSLIVMDEALSSLDVTTQAAMLELLIGLRRDENVSFLFITHDLQAVAYLCDRVLFLQAGRIVAESQVAKMNMVEVPYAEKMLRAAMPF